MNVLYMISLYFMLLHLFSMTGPPILILYINACVKSWILSFFVVSLWTVNKYCRSQEIFCDMLVLLFFSMDAKWHIYKLKGPMLPFTDSWKSRLIFLVCIYKILDFFWCTNFYKSVLQNKKIKFRFISELVDVILYYLCNIT